MHVWTAQKAALTLRNDGMPPGAKPIELPARASKMTMLVVNIVVCKRGIYPT